MLKFFSHPRVFYRIKNFVSLPTPSKRLVSQKRIDKLVRDKIPSIIEKSGKTCETTILRGAHYQQALQQKLYEEVDELNASTNEKNWLEELADIQEIVFSLLKSKGHSIKDLEKARMDKHQKRGGFDKGFFLGRISNK